MKKINNTFLMGLITAGLLHTTSVLAYEGSYFTFSVGNADDTELEENDSAIKLGVGADFNENLGFEIAYVDLGSYVSGLVSQNGIAMSGKVIIPLVEGFAMYARAGMYMWTFKLDYDFVSEETKGTDAFYGIGTKFNLSDTTAVILETENYEVYGGNITVATAGLQFFFD